MAHLEYRIAYIGDDKEEIAHMIVVLPVPVTKYDFDARLLGATEQLIYQSENPKVLIDQVKSEINYLRMRAVEMERVLTEAPLPVHIAAAHPELQKTFAEAAGVSR